MASTSEVTFGSRVANAEKLLAHLQSFNGYQSLRPDDTIEALGENIRIIKSNNSEVAVRKDAFALAANRRQQLFFKSPDSVQKLLSPILATVRARFGKDSKEAALVTATATRIRSTQVSKKKSDETEQFVSQSERSYGSMAQAFADLLSQLALMSGDYSPANPRIALPALQALLTSIGSAATEVTNQYNALKLLRDTRLTQYKELRDRVQRIKETVKSQYGNSSSEYTLVKSLKV